LLQNSDILSQKGSRAQPINEVAKMQTMKKEEKAGKLSKKKMAVYDE
jgi:hypothetical protein